MANHSLTHLCMPIKLEEIQDELGILLERANALTIVSLDETFEKNKASVRYSYLSTLQNLIQQAIYLHISSVGLRTEAKAIQPKN